MLTSYDIVKTLLRTEKGTMIQPQRKYLFKVDKRANKLQIKKAVEEIYNTQVDCVHTTIVPGKLKRVRQELGYTSEWKKAVVTLKEDQKIEVT